MTVEKSAMERFLELIANNEFNKARSFWLAPAKEEWRKLQKKVKDED